MKSRPIQSRLAALPLAAAALAFSALTGQCSTPLYPSVVQGDGALGYYRFNDSLSRTLINVNSGSLGAPGNATNDLAAITGGEVYSMPGAIVGDGNRASFFDFSTRTEIPFNAAVNTPNTQPFTVEAWLYPVSDQVGTGMGTLCNRWTQGGNRQGWVMYQRAADYNHNTTAGPGVGWELRMYNDLDGSGHLDVTSGVPFQLGKWQHVVFVYEPIGGDPTNSTLTIYIDGVAAATNINTSPVPGYGPCTGDHDPTQAVNGQPAMSLGGYNNANSGTAGFANPWTGGVDEFAYYNAKLTPAQILAHYQSGTNANRSTPYSTLIQSLNPVAYLRLGEQAPGPDTAFNIGDARAAGDAATTAAIKHPGTSALTSSIGSDGSHSGHYRDTSATGHALSSIPWIADNNPTADIPFTLEAWFRATGDQMNPGPCPINNRLANGIPDRTGWVIYQRDPNDSYKGPPAVSGESGLGWTFRPYTGSGGSSGGDLQLAAPYNLGEWVHFVVTWQPLQDIGTTSSGSEQWMGVLTGYINGVPVATNGDPIAFSGPLYAANVNPTADARTPADLAVGSYNAASGYGEEFEGDVDEVVLYNNALLTPDQILAHYQTGTNAHPATNYATLVFNAAGDAYYAANGYPIPERQTVPKTFLRFNEPAYFGATNSGSLGYTANGSLVMTTNIGTGPTSAGFEANNSSVLLDGITMWVSLDNPSGLQVSGQITLEAWVKPDTTQGTLARIISHGPPTSTVYDTNVYPIVLSGSQLSSNEVFLRIEGGATYAVGTSDGVTTHGTSAAIPSGDLGGGNWIYLAGTYDGTKWNLYRNGVLLSSTPDAVGALPVTGAEWAIGATGMGWADFYTGQVDEVAIYGTGLPASTINGHYYVGKNGTVSVSATHSGSTVTITWPAGTLQQADTASGPYADLTSATSPYSPPAGQAKKFYRVKL